MDEVLSAVLDDKGTGGGDYRDDNTIQAHQAVPAVSATVSGSVSIGGYDKRQRILVVGDGDFSFSLSMAVAFGSAPNLFATSLDSFEFLKENFMWSVYNIKELKARGCKVLHCVDATQMGNHPELSQIKFDRIIFNFPLAGFFPREVPRQLQIQVNQGLVIGFMANAKNMLQEDGEIHVTHKAYGFYRDWNLEQLGKSQGLWLREVVNFRLSDYPGYHTKYGFGGDKDFDCKNSKTYKFSLMP